MLKNKKILAILAVIAVLATSMFMLTGCGSEETTGGEETSTQQSSSTDTSSSSNSGTNTVIQLSVAIVNQYPNLTITGLYLSGAGQDAWGSELLNGQSMPTGTQLPLVLNIDKNNLKWDIKAVDETGTAVEFRNLDLSNVSTSGATITLMASEDGSPIAVAQ